MSMNIKSEDAHELARALSVETGETMTQAVTTALRERLDRLRHENSVDERAKHILEHGRAIAARLDDRTLQLDHADLLYDELGLPK